MGAWTHIRDLFAATEDARVRGYKPGRFSFNVPGGRCENCEGHGTIAIEMHFLPTVYVTCDICKGKRFDRETLEVEYKGKNIYDILKMTIEEAVQFFEDIPWLYEKLTILEEVGLGYLELGQSATTLSGGEAQRIKLSAELGKRDTRRTLYLLDEPTTGLHFADIDQLLKVLQRLVDRGNTVDRDRAQLGCHEKRRLGDRPRSRRRRARRHDRWRGNAGGYCAAERKFHGRIFTESAAVRFWYNVFMPKKSTLFVFAAIIFSFAIISAMSAVHAQSTDTIPPSAPTGLAVVAAPPAGITLSWSASSDNVGVAGYYVYRNGIAYISVTGTSFTDYSLPPATYSYAVAAYDAAGNVSQKSSSVSMAVILDTTPPSVPTGLSVSPTSTYVNSNSTSSIQVSLSWSASTDNVGVTGYNMYRNGVKITTSSSTVTGTSFTDVVSSTPWMYSYAVSAYDAAGNISGYSAPASISVVSANQAPSIPVNILVKQTGGSSVTLTWASSTDSIGVTGYDIYRNGSNIGTSATASYVDSNITAGTPYSYSVDAYDAAGNVSNTSVVVGILAVNDSLPPSVPFAVAPLIGSSTIKVSWYPSVDAVGVSGYDVYRNGSQIATTASTSYLDTAPITGENDYSIAAYNVSGVVSQTSTPISALYPAPTSTVSQVSTPAVVSAPVVVAQPSSPDVTAVQPALTASLSYGLRNDQVSALQSILAAHGYLTSTATTGFFGNLTLQAVQKFQCDNGIACSGAPGWGIVGPKTRTALNALMGGTASLNAEIQALQQELQALEAQLK